jgi:alpha-beta hydrolase superfamily lysophospholipase
MTALRIILTAWLIANLLHGLWTGCRRWCWESRIVRDKNGLLPQAEAYTRGQGQTALLFIHGFADTPMIWSPMVNHLIGQDASFTCRAMRLPGAGEPLQASRHITLDQWREAIDQEIALLRKDHAQVWLIAHSMGCAISIDAVLRNPGHVQGLILLAPLIKVSSAKTFRIPPEMGFRVAEKVFLLSPVFESMFDWKLSMPAASLLTYIKDRFIPFQTYRNLFTLTRSNRTRGNEIKIPVFSALSKYDRVVDSKAAAAWLDTLSGEKEIRWTETDHIIPIAPGWQALTDDIAAFIKNYAPLMPL